VRQPFDRGKSDEPPIGEPSRILSVDPTQRVSGNRRCFGDGASPKRPQEIAPGMALGRKNRRKEHSVRFGKAGAGASRERMCRTGDQPARVQHAPVRRLPNPRFREMDTVRMAARRQLRIAGNRHANHTPLGNTQDRLRKRRSSCRIARPQNDQTAARQHSRGGKRIGEPLVVRHQNECGQIMQSSRTRIETGRFPC
jgi:hypothetical protein